MRKNHWVYVNDGNGNQVPFHRVSDMNTKKDPCPMCYGSGECLPGIPCGNCRGTGDIGFLFKKEKKSDKK